MVSKILDENYVQIQGWMLNRLNLKSNKLLVFATIFGFTQDGETWFTGSAQYLGEWCGGIDRHSVYKLLSELIEENLLEKKSVMLPTGPASYYRVNLSKIAELREGNHTEVDGKKVTTPGKKVTTPLEEKLPSDGRKVTTPSNKSYHYNNINNNINNNSNNYNSTSTIVTPPSEGDDCTQLSLNLTKTIEEPKTKKKPPDPMNSRNPKKVEELIISSSYSDKLKSVLIEQWIFSEKVAGKQSFNTLKKHLDEFYNNGYNDDDIILAVEEALYCSWQRFYPPKFKNNRKPKERMVDITCKGNGGKTRDWEKNVARNADGTPMVF